MRGHIIKQITLSAFFLAIGLIFPVVFHMLGAGPTFLPMHIPIFFAGFILNLKYAAAVGVLTPIISSVFLSMPPAFPVLPYMIFELATYAVMSNLLYNKFNLNVYFSLVLSMISGRIVASIVVWIMAAFFFANLPGPLVFAATAIITGIPGILLQLVFIPAVVVSLQKLNIIKRKTQS